MKKYLVVQNDNATDVICQNRADAEEYILSCAEENLYEEMLIDVWSDYSESPQAFIQSYAEQLVRVRHHCPYSHIHTINGFMLYRKGICYAIDKVEELD